MPLDLTWLDLALLLVLLLALASGWRRGVGLVLGEALGTVLGLGAAAWAGPFVAALVDARTPDPRWRSAALVALVLVLLVIGLRVGGAVGARARRALEAAGLRRLDGLLGAGASLVLTALVLWVLAGPAAAVGGPAPARELARSRVLPGIERAMPAPVRAWAEDVRAAVAGLDVPPALRLPGPTDAAGGGAVRAGSWRAGETAA